MSFTRFGLLTTNSSYGVGPERLFDVVADVARAVDGSAFDTLWVPDHLVQGPVGDLEANRGTPTRRADGPAGRTAPILDAPTLLAALAVVTERVRIGPLVSPVTTRNPAVLAKSITTVDVVSGGRAVLGLGAAWDAEEHRRYGLPFPPPAARVDLLQEAVQLCRAMLDEEAATWRGQLLHVAGAVNVPRPVQDHLPILVGGSGPRTLRTAARHADACNPIGDGPHLREAFAVVDRECERVGRDPAEVAKVGGVMFHRWDDLYAGVEAAFAAGAEGVALVPWQLGITPDRVAEVGGRLAAEFSTA